MLLITSVVLTELSSVNLYDSMTLEQLEKEHEMVKRMFEGPFQKIKERLAKEENKA